MAQVMGTRASKESRAPEGRKKFNLSFFRPSGAQLCLATKYPRLAPWATFLRPSRACELHSCAPTGLVNYILAPLRGLGCFGLALAEQALQVAQKLVGFPVVAFVDFIDFAVGCNDGCAQPVHDLIAFLIIGEPEKLCIALISSGVPVANSQCLKVSPVKLP